MTKPRSTSETFSDKMRYLWYLIKRNPLSMAGLFLLLILVILAIFAPLFTAYDPNASDIRNMMQPPSAEHIFGTDSTGKDIFARCLYGARFDLGIAIGAVVVSLVLGVPLGAYLGYKGGRADEFIMRILDSVQAFPSFVLAMLIISTIGQDVTSLMIVIGFVNFPAFTRLVRAEMMSRKHSQYVEAARCVGNSTASIIFRHILPNCTSPIINQAALTCGWAIITTAGLGFLGLGVKIPNPEWGSMISSGAQYVLTGEWWWSFFPGICIALTVLAFNLMGDAVDDILDPRRR